jgi:prevent-host-death family protein
MKTLHDIKPITYLKTQSAALVKMVTARKSPVVITQNGEAMVVVQDIASYERDRNALLMFKILAEGVRDAEAKNIVDQDGVFKVLEAKYS